MNASTPRSASLAVIGGGAIGGFVAARLVQAGHRVTLCVRSPIESLVLDSGGDRLVTHPRILTQPGEAQPMDWVFLATKAHDTPGAAPWLAKLCHAATTLVILQNGIDHAARVQPYAGPATILPSLVYIGAERVAPGHIVQHGGGKLIVPAGEAAGRLEALLEGSGIEVEQTSDFLTSAWTKILGNIAGNPLTALTMRRIGILREKAMRELALGLLEEAVAVGRACGARLPRNQARDILDGLASYNPEGGTSMLYDRMAGRALEHEHITGAVVRAASQHAIPVPLNRAILTLVTALSEGFGGGRGEG